MPKKIKGFTLIELLIVVAIMGILAAVVIIAINPAKRTKQARDAQRRSNISQIASALVSYEALSGLLPGEGTCDSSIGLGAACPINPPQSSWSTAANSYIYTALVGQGFLKKLPIDPINDSTNHYRYEPRNLGQSPCTGGGATAACRYWIGGELETKDNTGNPIIYRCSDIENLAAGAGCKEVSSFDL